MFNELSDVIKTSYENINGIIVSKGSNVIFEEYYNNTSAETKHHIASVTKSVMSSLIGIAIDKGFINSVEDKISDFFSEYKNHEIKLKHLLTMTAPYPYEPWKEPLETLSKQPHWLPYILENIGKGGEIGPFKYSTASAHLLSIILEKSTGLSSRAFANDHLFNKIDVEQIPDYSMEQFGFDELFGSKVRGWVKDPDGYSTGGWGLNLSVREMSSFGQLYLNNGMFNGEQIVSKSWVEASTLGHSNGYGYMWWLIEEEELSAYAAIGDGGNMICVIPKYDLVVAIASSFMINSKDRLELIKEYILKLIR